MPKHEPIGHAPTDWMLAALRVIHSPESKLKLAKLVATEKLKKEKDL